LNKSNGAQSIGYGNWDGFPIAASSAFAQDGSVVSNNKSFSPAIGSSLPKSLGGAGCFRDNLCMGSLQQQESQEGK
jgi:hypothetical protein